VIDILFDDVECEIVGPTEGPDGDREQGKVTPGKERQEKNSRRSTVEERSPRTIKRNPLHTIAARLLRLRVIGI
jgi:hypothetical protein